jgi:hypothetical protein
MNFTLLVLLFLVTHAVANVETNHKSLTDLLEVGRDTVFSSKQRQEYLEFSRKMMVKKLAQELQVSEGELNLSFVKNPTRSSFLMENPWFDLQTQFYTTLHQENFYQRWIGLQKLVKFSDYGKSIQATMMAHLGQFSPVEEGRFYVRWAKIGINSGDRTRRFNIPYFLMSKNIRDLIDMEAHVPFEDLIPNKDLTLFLRMTSKMSRLQKQELAEKSELNRRIYLRAIANSAKTIGSIHHLSGSLTRQLTERKVSEFISDHCESCSAREKSEQQTGAMKYLDTMKKIISYSGPSDVAVKFCRTLRANNYHWNIDRLKPTPVELLADQTQLARYYVHHKLKEKNRGAMAKAILTQDLGVLFLTNAINVLDKQQEPVGTKINCTQDSQNSDTRLVLQAIEEAERNIEIYAKSIGSRLKRSLYDLSATNRTLEYFIQTNQASSIEATSSYPQGIGWILKSIAELDQNTSRRQKIDSIVTWGGAIVGIGLTLTGIGAPEGVAMLISTAGLIRGVSSGTYYLVRSKQEKRFAREMRLAKNGGSGLSHENLKLHYARYKSLKVAYIKEFSTSAFSFINLYRTTLKATGGNIEKTHSILEKVAKTARETGKETLIEKLQENVLELALKS